MYCKNNVIERKKMERFDHFMSAYAVRYKGKGDFYEPWLLNGRTDVLYLKKLTGKNKGSFSVMTGELSDYFGYTEEEYLKKVKEKTVKMSYKNRAIAV